MITPAAVGRPRGPTEELETRAPRRTGRALALAIPVVVPAGMRVLFPLLVRRLGARRGYLAGFGVYWAGCYLVPAALLGRRRVWALLGKTPESLPRPRWLGALALAVPPLGAVGTELLPALREADPGAGRDGGRRGGRQCHRGGAAVARAVRGHVPGRPGPRLVVAGHRLHRVAPGAVVRAACPAGQAVPGRLRPHRRRLRVGRVAHSLTPVDPAGSPRHRCQRATSGPVLAGPPDVQLTPTRRLA